MVQLIGIVVADTEARARAAARQVRVEYEDLPALLSAMEVADAPEGLGKEFTVRPHLAHDESDRQILISLLVHERHARRAQQEWDIPIYSFHEGPCVLAVGLHTCG